MTTNPLWRLADEAGDLCKRLWARHAAGDTRVENAIVHAALREGRRLTAAVAQRGVCRTCCGSGRQRRSAPDGTYLGMGPCPDCQEASRRPDIVH